MDTQKYRILVVDDNPDWQLTFRGVLKSAGYDVTTAGSTEEAVQQLVAARFDLALLDIRLDESDENDASGLKLAEEINRRWENTKVVIATGYASDEYVKKAMLSRAGKKRLAVNFIQKHDVDSLADVVGKALAK